jgi:dienelactone hydrolase
MGTAKKILTLLLLTIGFQLKSQSLYDFSYNKGENYDTAGFRCWLPKTKIQAFVVVVPGYNSDGREAVNDSIWQTFAKHNNFGIIACYYKDYKSSNYKYREASKGSGQALLNFILHLSDSIKSPAITHLPLFLWGHSAGGQFNYEFACWKPKKVAAFIVNKGGYYHTFMASDETRKVPGLFFYGENDLYYRVNSILGIYSVNRKKDALWTLFEEKETQHEIGISKELSIEYFSRIIDIRLNDDGSLKDINNNQHYIGYWNNKTIKENSGVYQGDTLTVWLPDSNFAKRWEKYYE